MTSGVCYRAQEAERGGSEDGGPAQLVHVRFTFDRTPLRRMHAALQHACNPCLQLLPVRSRPTLLLSYCALPRADLT